MMTGMTPAQIEALQKAYTTLGEHFDHVVIVLNWDTDEDIPSTGTKMEYKGGAMTALGLLTWGQDRILDVDRREKI